MVRIGWDFGFLKVRLPQPKDALASVASFTWEGGARCITQSILLLAQNASCQLDHASKTRDWASASSLPNGNKNTFPSPCGPRSITQSIRRDLPRRCCKQAPGEEFCGNSGEQGAHLPCGVSLQWHRKCLEHPCMLLKLRVSVYIQVSSARPWWQPWSRRQRRRTPGRQRVPRQCRPWFGCGWGTAVEGERLASSVLSLFCQRVGTSQE